MFPRQQANSSLVTWDSSRDYSEDGKPSIVGARPGGEILSVDELSDGTRDQLFLSLRLASIEGYLEPGAREDRSLDHGPDGSQIERDGISAATFGITRVIPS